VASRVIALVEALQLLHILVTIVPGFYQQSAVCIAPATDVTPHDFRLNRISERLWVRPLAMCVLSTVVVFLAKTVDNTAIDQLVPDITPDSIVTPLTIISASMLVIATFAVAAMVSAGSTY
jgi:uncharacterized membrane protein